MKYYYTFDKSNDFPYQGGWVEVEAPNIKIAHAIFTAYYPDRTTGILNCADYYTEASFKRTGMLQNGNWGAFCHCKLTVEKEQMA